MSRFGEWMRSATTRERSQRPSLVRWFSESGTGRVLLMVVFVSSVVAVLHAGSSVPIDRLDDDDVGTVLRRPIIATHDFQWERVDDAQLEHARQEAINSVLPVWDYEADRVDIVGERVERAFHAARTRLATAALLSEHERAAEQVEDDDEAPPRPPPDLQTIERAAADVAGRHTAYLESIGRLSEDERRDVITDDAAIEEFIRHLQRSVPEDALSELAAEGFSHDTEMALRRILGTTLDRRIVEDRRVLEAESGAGIQLRIISRTGSMRESRVRDFDGFLGTDDVLQFVERQTALEGGLTDSELRDVVLHIAEQLVQPNTRYNDAETEARRSAAAEAVTTSSQVQSFRRGQIVLDAGRVVTEETLAISRAMERTADSAPHGLWMAFGLAVLVGLVSLPLVAFSIRYLHFFTRRLRDLLMMGTLLVVHLAFTRVSIFLAHLVVDAGATFPHEAFFVLVPFATGAMIVRILTTAENALVYAIVYALLTGVLFQFDLSWVIFALVASIAGSSAVGVSLSRTEVIRAGFVVGLTMLGIAVGLGFVLSSLELHQIAVVAAMALVSGLISALLVFTLMPLFEQLFGYTTSFRLLELANLNHPALRELILQAPGSYHHSMMVGQLVEAACEAVGANSLLGRVGAYFHDIGKGKNPRYFAENQSKENPHDRLKPHMSALIIKAHVKDGIEMARQHKLPPELIDFIREHHGTSRIEYFYHRAVTESDGEVDEHDYRYPGPRPQTRETAICLLADGIEAASRTLPDPTPARIAQLVNKLINKAFSDGQLEECDLTLRDLNLIANAFIKRLTAFYHHRPEYPEARKSQQLRAQRRTTPTPAAATPTSPVGTSAGPGDHDDTPPQESDDRPDGGDEPPGADGQNGGDTTEESGVHLRRLGL